MGYHVHVPYLLQVAAELVWADSHAGREGLAWYLFEMCEESVNSEFTSEEDADILERAGNVQEWWVTQLEHEIDMRTLAEMYDNYLLKVKAIICTTFLSFLTFILNTGQGGSLQCKWVGKP